MSTTLGRRARRVGVVVAAVVATVVGLVVAPSIAVATPSGADAVAACTTCPVVSAVFYEPWTFADPPNTKDDGYGLAHWVEIGDQTITMPKAFKDADHYLDSYLGHSASTAPDTNGQAGNYHGLWQITVIPRHTLSAGDTVTITAPQPHESYEQTAGTPAVPTNVGTVFPKAEVTVPGTMNTDPVTVFPYAFVPGLRGCGPVNDEDLPKTAFCDEDAGTGGAVGPGTLATTVTRSNAGRSVTITVPSGLVLPAPKSSTEFDFAFTIMVAGVLAPPGGEYDPSGFTVSTSRDGLPAPDGYGVDELHSNIRGPHDNTAADPSIYHLGYGSTGVPVAGNSNLTLSATTAEVGGSGVTATATVADVLHNPVSDKPVAIADANAVGGGTAGNEVLTPKGSDENTGDYPHTGSDGQVQYQVTDSRVQDVPLVALPNPGSPSPVYVPCDPGGSDCTVPTVSFVAAAPDPDESAVSVDHADRPADGTTAAVVAVTLKDQYGNPDIGHQVLLSPVSGSASPHVVPHSGYECTEGDPTSGACTNGKGVAELDVTDPHPETVSLSVLDMTTTTPFPTDSDLATIAFHPMSPSNSMITAASSTPAVRTSTTVTVTISDDETPVAGMAGREVQLTATAGSPTITPANPTTDSGGAATFTVSDDTAEAVTVQATDVTDGQTLTNTAALTFEPVSSLVASPATVVGDGSATSTLTLTLLHDGLPVTDENVTLGMNNTCTPGTQSATTDNDGTATFTVTNDTPGTVRYWACGDSQVVGPTSVTYLAVPDGTNSSLSAKPTSVVADGLATAKITVTAKDSSGNVIAGLPVTLAQDGNSMITASGPAVTDSDGTTTFTVSDSTVENVTYQANYRSGTPTTFGNPVTVAFTQPPDEAHESSVNASPTDKVLAGSGTSTVTVTLRDADSQPIFGHSVALRSGSPTLTVKEVTTNAETDRTGQVQFSVSDSVPQQVTIRAVDLNTGVIALRTASITFTAPPPTDPANSTVIADPPSLAAGGPASTVTVALKDSGGNPEIGHTVALHTQSATASITSQNTVTDGSGYARFTVIDSTAEQITVTATDVTDNVTLGGTATITFTTTPTEANQSTVTASPSALPAGGPATTVSVTLTDASGEPLNGHTVVLDTGSDTTTVAALTAGGVTDSSGQVQFRVADSSAESVVVRATDATTGTVLQQTPKITFEATEANQSSVAVSPANQIVGKDVTVTVILVGASGRPFAGHTVVVSLGSSAATVGSSSPVTGADGVATFTLTDRMAERIVVRVTDQTSGTALDQTATVTFFGHGKGH